METETVSSRNVVDLMLNDEFGASICGRSIAATEHEEQSAEKVLSVSQDAAEDYAYGWDC